MNNIQKQYSTNIYAAGLVDEGLDYDSVCQKLETTEILLKSQKPICPYCKSEMCAYSYVGYYDVHDCWFCDCDKIPNAKLMKGLYA